MNGYNISTDLPAPPHVRALFDYDADDQTSLSFQKGDIITVINQLDSGWWDGYLNNKRGWFPSNYCAIVDDQELDDNDGSDAGLESGTEEDYDTDSDAQTQDDDSELRTHSRTSHETGIWMPQATPDGRVFYFNTRTGESATRLPLESPFVHERGPSISSIVYVPAQTRVPADLATKGSIDESSIRLSTSIARKMSQPGSALGRNDANLSPLGAPFAPNGTTATSFSLSITNQSLKNVSQKYFADDPTAVPVTWESLLANMQHAVEDYCAAVRKNDRAQYVRRAEDISDHLRMLLAAGSGTTDNHSGNPSIISANKALYPHFREMMSKFSKLVLASHMAAVDWPGPETEAKCLQEADGVLSGAVSYAEVARQQRGNGLPRLLPGFLADGLYGGHWRDNNIDAPYVSNASRKEDRSFTRPHIVLDATVLKSLEESRSHMLIGVKQLEEQLQVRDNTITPAKQMAVGYAICLAASTIIDHFRPWIAIVEGIDLGAAGTIFQKPLLLEFASQKQKAYDSIGDLVSVCQAITLPLPDEWSEQRGETLQTRLLAVRSACDQFRENTSQVNGSLQLLEPSASAILATPAVNKKDHRMTAPTTIGQKPLGRSESTDRPSLAEIGQSRSFTAGESKGRRPSRHQIREPFGQVPPILNNENDTTQNDDRPWFLRLDHENEVHVDSRTVPPQVKSGTLAGLVEQLTRHDRLDGVYQTTFLLTYRSFVTATDLFSLLVKRFNIQPPPNLTRDEMSVWSELKQGPIRFRVVNTMYKWVEQYWMEGSDPDTQQLLERMNTFAKNTVTNAKIPGGAPLATAIEMRLKGQDTSTKKLVLTLTGSAPPSILPKNMKKLKFLDIDPLEFARQLTIVESRLYGRIKPVECLEKIWERKDVLEHDNKAPNIRALILHSNQITNCVAEQILNHGEIKKRVAVVKHAILIADVSSVP